MNPTRSLSHLSALLCGAFGLALTAGAQIPNTLLHSLPAPPVGAQSGAGLGSSVAVEGGYTVVGAPDDDLGGTSSGVVKVFDSTTGALLFVLANPGPAVGDNFGWSVAISGPRVVVGAYRDDTGAADAGSAYVYDLSSGTPTVPVTTLNNPSPTGSDYFGWSVSISGSRVVVGAYGDDTGATDAGSAYGYDLGSGTPTVPVATLHKPGPAVGDNFGYTVAVSGTRVVVGALGDDTGAPDAGSAYVYDLSSGTPTVPVATLNNPGPALSDYFGVAVAVSGTRVVVGAFGDDTGAGDAGSAYLYDLVSGTPTVPVTTLNNPGPAASDYFGISVAISGTRVVVGAFWDDTGATDAGSAYAYDLSSGTPTVPVATLNNPGPVEDDSFGIAVAISGTQVVVGADFDDTGAADAGSAYGYDLASGTPTVPVATMNNPGPAPYDYSGYSVAISGTWVVVGVPFDDTGATNSGSTYLYDLSSGTPTVPMFTLYNPFPAVNDQFGFAVAISGTQVVVGARFEDTSATDAGSAYVYDLSSGTPTVPVTTLHNPSPAVNSQFGYSVAISGTRVVAGAFLDDTGAADAGSAYVYDLSNGTPTVPVATLHNPGPAVNDWFGWSVGISGSRVVVGSRFDDTGATNAGSAYVYDLGSGTPTVPVATLNNPGPAADEEFGYAVAISGPRVVVGAYRDDTGATDAGSAYVYDLGSGTPTVPVATLTNPGPGADEEFGYSVAISGARVVVGARLDDTGATNAGSAYVYNLSSGTPTVPVATLDNPGAAVGDNFGFSVAIDGTTVAIGAPGDDSVMLDKGAAYIFGPAPDLNTETPTLTAPASLTVTGSPLSVDFALPETALPGSVKLTFTGPATTVLTLVGAQGTAGAHAFTLLPGNLSVSAAVSAVSGPNALPDGVYTVTLEYQDAAGNPAASATATNLTLAAAPYSQWRLTFFSNLNAPDTDNADGDPFVNLTEYGLVLLPTTFSAAPVSEPFTYPEGDRLRIVFTRDPARYDVTIEVLAADDLAGPWTPVASSVLGAVTSGAGYYGGDSAGPGLKSVEVRDLYNLGDPAHPRRFLRLRISY